MALTRRSMVRALVIIAACAPFAAAAGISQGTGAMLWVVFGLLTGAGGQALLGPAWALGLCAGTATIVSAATAARGQALAIGVIVAAAAVLAGIAARRSGSLVVVAPALAAVAGSVNLGASWLVSGAWLLAGGICGMLLAWLARAGGPLRPADTVTAIVQGAVLAVLCGTAAGLAVALGLPHGYWIVLALVSVVRPGWNESAARARVRIAGTLAGAVVPVPLAAFLPGGALAILAIVSFYLFLAYLLAGAELPEVAFLTITTIFIASGGIAANTASTGAYRVLWTLVGVGAAALVAGAIWYCERAVRARRGAPGHAGLSGG